MRTLIVGCGYLGTATGRMLVDAGHEVFGMRRDSEHGDELREAGIYPLVADIADANSLLDLPTGFEWVVNTVTSSRGGAEEYRQVYLQGTRHLLAWLKPQPLMKYVYTSSTSVYSQSDGSEVTENCPTVPSSETTRFLVETEALLLEAARSLQMPTVILRLSGIYGPGRGHLFQQMLSGQATISGDGSRILNMIHRDDAAKAIVAALGQGRPGQVYNVTDDQPVSQLEFLTFLGRELKRPLPPTGVEAPLNRKRGLTNKKVSNARLRTELGWKPNYPTYREGYAQEIAQTLSGANWLLDG